MWHCHPPSWHHWPSSRLLHLMMSQRKVPKADVCPFVCPSHMCHSRELQHICYTLKELRARHHQAVARLLMGNHHKTPVQRTARRGWTGKTNISNKEQVWTGWIHLSLTPTDHLFDCAHWPADTSTCTGPRLYEGHEEWMEYHQTQTSLVYWTCVNIF